MYAREHAQPRLTTSGTERIASLYEQLRQESISGDSIPVTVRLVESIIRMSEAHARMHLRSVVQGDDIDMAIRVCLESFINAQKYSLMRQMRRVRRLDCDARRLLTSKQNSLFQSICRSGESTPSCLCICSRAWSRTKSRTIRFDTSAATVRTKCASLCKSLPNAYAETSQRNWFFGRLLI